MRYYHLCSACNAKWFAKEPVKRCPRCDGGDLSVELREPPWENYATSGSDASSEAAALDPEGPKEIAYCEQHNEH